MTTGQKIAKCRKDKNLTQENLAGMMGVSRQAVSRWESDLAFPETDNLAKMSKIFGVTADYLLNYGNDGEESANSSVNTEKSNTGINFRDKIKNFHIEYKSKKRVGNLPLVHINIGAGRTANGVFAIGLKSKGIVSVGLLSCGILSIGLLSFGLISFGSVAIGLLSAGSFATGIIALGAITAGIFAMGAINFGLFSVGASYGWFVAIGDRAYGGIALGSTVASGRIFSATTEQFTGLKNEIYIYFNEIPSVFLLFTRWCREIFENILNGAITLGGY